MIRKFSYLYSRFLKKYLRGKAIKNSTIDGTAIICSGSQVIDSSIGRYSNSGYDCQILNCDIGSFCSIAANVVIGSSEHPLDWVSISPVFENVKNSGSSKRFARLSLPEAKRTTIGNDVWIGYGAIIKAGVCIGTGAVIGSAAVVTKNVEPYAIVAGCPAKLIRYRFDEPLRRKLLNSKWWELSDDNLTKVGLFVNDPNKFLSKLDLIEQH